MNSKNAIRLRYTPTGWSPDITSPYEQKHEHCRRKCHDIHGIILETAASFGAHAVIDAHPFKSPQPMRMRELYLESQSFSAINGTEGSPYAISSHRKTAGKPNPHIDRSVDRSKRPGKGFPGRRKKQHRRPIGFCRQHCSQPKQSHWPPR